MSPLSPVYIKLFQIVNSYARKIIKIDSEAALASLLQLFNCVIANHVTSSIICLICHLMWELVINYISINKLYILLFRFTQITGQL